jgi:AraC-like DNA-binding protein
MKKTDLTKQFPGLFIIHQKIRDHQVDHHVHSDHELFFPLQGEIQLLTLSRTLKAGPGKMLYLPPNCEHAFTSDSRSQGERLIVIISAELWKKYGGREYSPTIVPISQLSKELLFHLLIHPDTKASKVLIETIVRTTFEVLDDAATQPQGHPSHLKGLSQDPRVKQALEMMEENFQEPLSIEQIARDSGMSTRNFNRLFLTETGVTPKVALTLFRIYKAKELLSLGHRTVTDIAFEVGYNSVSQF